MFISMEEKKVPLNQRLDYGVDIREMENRESGFVTEDFPWKTLNEKLMKEESNDLNKLKEKY